MTNRYTGTCATCGNMVPANTGRLERVNGSWTVTHTDTCPPKAQPATPAQQIAALNFTAVPEGLFEAAGTIFQVDKPDQGAWEGYTFVKVVELTLNGSRVKKEKIERAAIAKPGQGVRPMPRHAEALALLVIDPRAAMLRVGAQYGICGHCGRLLTDELSIAAGIGPVCADKLGLVQEELAGRTAAA